MNLLSKIKSKKYYVKSLYKDICLLSDRIEDHHLFMIASGIAFNILIYIIPLFLLVIFLISMTFNTIDITLYIEQLFNSFLPPNPDSRSMMKIVIGEVDNIFLHSSLFGLIGMIGLLWVSSTLISSIRTGLNVIFNIETPKIFIFYRIKDIFLTIILTIFVFIYSYIIPIISLIKDFIDSFMPDYLDRFIGSGLILTASITSSFVVYYFIYKFLPNKKLPRNVVLLSTVMSVILIEIARYTFAWYIGKISDYGKFYGTYAVIISLSIWIYYFALILLLSAEVSKFVNDRKIEIAKGKEIEIENMY